MRHFVQTLGLLSICLVLTSVGCMRAFSHYSPDGPKMGTSSGVNLGEILPQFQQGIEFLESGRIDEAKTVFEDLRYDYPHISVFHHNLGVAYKRLGLLDQAVGSYREAIHLNGSYPEPYYNLGIALREKGDFQGAEKKYKKALALNPSFGDAHFNLAVLYDLYLNIPKEAIKHYQVYLGLTPGNHGEIQIWITGLQKRMEE